MTSTLSRDVAPVANTRLHRSRFTHGLTTFRGPGILAIAPLALSLFLMSSVRIKTSRLAEFANSLDDVVGAADERQRQR